MQHIKGLTYFGSKYKSLPQILPVIQSKLKNKTYFVDCFAGGLNVSLNLECKNIISIDTNYRLLELFEFIKHANIPELIEEIYSIIKSNKINTKEGYYDFKSFFNLQNESTCSKYYTYLLVLYYHSFNNILRFNKSGEFNTPYGYRTFSKIHSKNLLDINRILNHRGFSFLNMSFSDAIRELLLYVEKDFNKYFFYLDPPYINTASVYDNWSEDDEYMLYSVLNKFIELDIDFALSNCLTVNGKANYNLNKFLEKNSDKLKIIYIDSTFNNSCYNRKAKNDSVEVLIYNKGVKINAW